MNPIFYFIIEYYSVILIILFLYTVGYLNFQRKMKNYVSLIHKNIKDNAHLFTPEMRAFIEKTVQECGVTAAIVPITGWRHNKLEEPVAFGILPSTDKNFYLNIPLSWVSFLDQTLSKKQSNGSNGSAEETQKLNGFIWIMHHEMNHVKSMIARKSAFGRPYPWKRALLSIIFNVFIWMYIAHIGIFNDVSSHMTEGNYDVVLNMLAIFIIFGSIGFMIVWSYIAYMRCREEYACDVRGIEDIAVLRGGIDWLLHDAQAYVDGLFKSTLKYLGFLYRLFPNALCSFFTLHPHPIARAVALERKIAALQARG